MNTTFFPLPDNPSEPQHMEIHGARVIQVLTTGTDVVFLAMAEIGMEILGFRFMLPNHTKTARLLFRGAGLREVPSTPQSFVLDTKENSALFLVSFRGTCVGEDDIPDPDKVPMENTTGKPLTHVYVLTDVHVIVLVE